MAFVQIDKYTAQALEKGLASAIKVADIRYTSVGPDLRKRTADDFMVGAVAYVVPNDKVNDIEGPGKVTKMFFDCTNNTDKVMVETVNSNEAAVAASLWVDTVMGLNVSAIRAKCPA